MENEPTDSMHYPTLMQRVCGVITAIQQMPLHLVAVFDNKGVVFTERH